jgi:hypothetical protein
MNPAEAGHRFWERARERPFGQLVQLSLNRMLQGAQDDTDEVDADVGRLLVLLALPGAIVSFILFDKYGTLLQFIRGQMHFDPYRASVSDEYFFIALSMAVCGSVAVWKATSIFPDRRDYLNLVPLPIQTRTILGANIFALTLFSLLFTVDVNAVSGWMFPVVVAASNGSTRDFAIFLASHLAAVGAASLFSFAAVFAVLGTAMTVLPASVFRRVSVHLNSAIIVAMLALLLTTQTFAAVLMRSQAIRGTWMLFLPSLWFVGLCQSMRGIQGSTSGLWIWALAGLAAACALALLTYALQYRRHFVRTAELIDGPGWSSGAGWLRPAGRLLDAALLRTPCERSGYRYVLRTLARSARHRLVLAGFVGLGAVLAVQTMSGNRGEPTALPNVTWLSIGFIVNFFVIAGMRFVFDIPAELKANWTFQLWVAPDRDSCNSLARKVILSAALLCTWTAELLLYLDRWGWRTALINAAVLSISSILLTEIALGNFPKIPFTCSYPAFRQGSIAGFVIMAVGFAAFSFGIPALEHWARPVPWHFPVLVAALAAGWYGVARYRSEMVAEERQLIFEERAQNAVELLNLNGQ